MMWETGLQNLKHSKCSVQFYSRSQGTLENLDFDLYATIHFSQIIKVCICLSIFWITLVLHK